MCSYHSYPYPTILICCLLVSTFLDGKFIKALDTVLMHTLSAQKLFVL